MKLENDEVIFESTGRRVYWLSDLSDGFLCHSSNPGTVYYGTCDDFALLDDLTLEERIEVAEWMIEQWRAWLKNCPIPDAGSTPQSL